MKTESKRTVENLLRLREKLKMEIPPRTLNETLLLATWNIRDFDRPAYGQRLDEAIYYIAEIISHFDIIAIQEVNKDMTALNRVLAILGSNWDKVFSDVTEGDHGNDEIMVFLYDKRKVSFGGLAGELVLPPFPDGRPAEQIWRTPMICGFQSGWAKFMLATVHVQWGKETDRVEEIRRIAKFLRKRTDDKTAWARKLILVGDFNTPHNDHRTFKPLLEEGFQLPDLLKDVHSTPSGKQYDRIMFREREHSLKYLHGGTFNFYDTVFREEDWKIYDNWLVKADGTKPKNPSKYFKTYWRTHQMSDHLPLWVAFKIDYSDEYLEDNLEAHTT